MCYSKKAISIEYIPLNNSNSQSIGHWDAPGLCITVF